MKTILICGHRSYVARNFESLLKQNGYEVVCFSRGAEKREGNVVTGDVLKIDKNQQFHEQIDVIVNFIFLQGQSIEDNLEYIRSLKNFALQRGVKRLIQISSISSYPNELEYINENTQIDRNGRMKGNYGAVKSIVDLLLEQYQQEEGLPVVFVRPGYVVAPDKENPLAGIVIALPFKGGILRGNAESTLPIVDRDDLQKGLLKIIEDKKPNNVYLMVSKEVQTKIGYAKSVSNRWLIPLPKSVVLGMAKIFEILHLIDERKYLMVKGQFKVNKFDAEETYKKIGKVL